MKTLNFINIKGTSADALIMTFVKLLTSLLSVVGIKIVSESFSLNEYGTYAQALLIVTTLTSIMILGMTDGINYYYNNHIYSEQKRLSYVTTLFGLQTIIGVGGGILFLFCGNLLTDYFNNPTLKVTYVWIAFQPLLNNYLPMLQCLYISLGKAKLIAYRNLVLSIFRLLVFIWACYVTKDIITILAACFIFDLIQTVYFIILLRKYGICFFIKKFNINLISPILKYCVPIATFIVLNSLLRDVDKWIVGYYGDTDEVAIYANCSRVLPFDMLTVSFAMILTPILTRYISTDISKIKEILAPYLNLSLITTSILVFPAIILSKDLLLTLYAPDFLPGLEVFILYLLVDVTRFANLSILFSASGRSKHLMIIAFCGLLLNTVLAIFLYKLCGMIGPAIATLFVMCGTFIFFIIGGSKIINNNIIKLLNIRHYILLLIEIFIIYICYLFLKDYLVSINTVIKFLIEYIPMIVILCTLNKKQIFNDLRLLNSFK